MDVNKKKQISYLGFMDDKLRIAHTVRPDSPLRPVPDSSVFDGSDKLQRSNVRKQIRLRKKVMAGLHQEIRELEELLDD